METRDLRKDGQSRRLPTALVHTQILNEGWASIMQEIIPQYTKKQHSFPFWLNASKGHAVRRKTNLRDPYSLGVFAWRRIKERFEARAEIKSLSTQLEKDREFIRFATEESLRKWTMLNFCVLL